MPRFSSSSKETVGIKEFCIFRMLGGLRRCGYFWILLFQSSTLPQLRCCLGWLEQSPAWLVRTGLQLPKAAGDQNLGSVVFAARPRN